MNLKLNYYDFFFFNFTKTPTKKIRKKNLNKSFFLFVVRRVNTLFSKHVFIKNENQKAKFLKVENEVKISFFAPVIKRINMALFIDR